MIIYIKDKKTFVTTHTAVAASYEIHESIYDTVSKITIQTPKSPPNEGDLVLFDGLDYVGIITEVNTDKSTTEITCQQGMRMFSRNMFYSAWTYTYLEDNLKDVIDTNFTNCSDEVYEIPYLNVIAATHTSGNVKPDLEQNIFSVSSYISKLRRLRSIVCDWSFTNTGLTLTIYKKTFPVYNIDLSNPRIRVKEQTLSKYLAGKITVFAEDNSTYYTRYKKTDGTIVASKPSLSDRVDGEWLTMTIFEHTELDDSVQDAFAQNTYSHKITLETDLSFNLYDQLVIRTEGKIFSSYVSGIIRRNNTTMTEVECGELQTTYPFLDRI